MNEYTIEQVIELAEDFKREFKNKDDIDEFNQAVMRLADAVSNLHVVDSFDEIKD